MKKLLIIISIWTFCFLFMQLQAQNKSRVDFDKGWKFKLDSIQSYSESNIDDGNWRTLNLPHDWSIEGSFSKDNPATPGGGQEV